MERLVREVEGRVLIRRHALAAAAVVILAAPQAVAQSGSDGSGLEYFHYDLLMAGPQLGVAFRF